MVDYQEEDDEFFDFGIFFTATLTAAGISSTYSFITRSIKLDVFDELFCSFYCKWAARVRPWKQMTQFHRKCVHNIKPRSPLITLRTISFCLQLVSPSKMPGNRGNRCARHLYFNQPGQSAAWNYKVNFKVGIWLMSSILWYHRLFRLSLCSLKQKMYFLNQIYLWIAFNAKIKRFNNFVLIFWANLRQKLNNL